jgi:hypothetical protein
VSATTNLGRDDNADARQNGVEVLEVLLDPLLLRQLKGGAACTPHDTHDTCW